MYHTAVQLARPTPVTLRLHLVRDYSQPAEALGRKQANTHGTGLLPARGGAGPKEGDYSWHGTTPSPRRRWAESRRLLMARDYSKPAEALGRKQATAHGTGLLLARDTGVTSQE